MKQPSYSIQDNHFFTKQEYEAGLRDLKKIEAFKKRADLEFPETASKLYQMLLSYPDFFESHIGDEFLHQLQQCAAGRPPGDWLRTDREKEIKENNEIFSEAYYRKMGYKRQRYKKSKNWKAIFILTAIIVLLCIILYQVGYGIYYNVASYLSEKKLKELASCIVTPIEGFVSEENRELDKAAGIYKSEEGWEIGYGQSEANSEVLFQYSNLYDRNNDMTGWISIEGTVINYPVMQTKQEEEYYLKRNFDKKKDINGLPFMDVRSNIRNPESNLIIYGHNMKNGSMFSALLNYAEEEFYLEHPIFQFDTIYKTGQYEIVAVFLTEVGFEGDGVFRYYRYDDLSSRDQFDEYISNIKRLSFYDTGVIAEYGDSIVTLSTCDRSIVDGRFVVVGRRLPE